MRTKLFTRAALATAITLGLANPVLAESTVVQDELIFLANGDLLIYDTDATLLATVTVGNATDVIISGCKAIITTDSGGTKGITVADLTGNSGLPESFCSGGGNGSGEGTDDDDDDSGDNDDGGDDNDSDEEKPFYDIINGTLTIPYVDADGKAYSLEMKRRGNSDNWEITFIEEVEEDDSNSGDDEQPSFNAINGTLTIPYVAADGTAYTLEMKRRGNSDNWEVTFIEEVPVETE